MSSATAEHDYLRQSAPGDWIVSNEEVISTTESFRVYSVVKKRNGHPGRFGWITDFGSHVFGSWYFDQNARRWSDLFRTVTCGKAWKAISVLEAADDGSECRGIEARIARKECSRR